MKQLLYTIAAIPALALIGGIGVLAFRIGETWDSTTTKSLVTALTVICGGGALIFAFLLALIVGIPLAIRAYGEGGVSRRKWGDLGGSRRRRSGVGWEDAWTIDETSHSPKNVPRLIDGQWHRLPEPNTSSSPAQPHTQLLPPAEQDARFGIER